MCSEVRYDVKMVGKEMRGRREVWNGREVSWQVWVGQVCVREGSGKKSSKGRRQVASFGTLDGGNAWGGIRGTRGEGGGRGGSWRSKAVGGPGKM